MKKIIVLLGVSLGLVSSGMTFAQVDGLDAVLGELQSIINAEIPTEEEVPVAVEPETHTQTGSHEQMHQTPPLPSQKSTTYTVSKNTTKTDLPFTADFYRSMIRAIQIDNVKKSICEMGYAGTSAQFVDVDFSTRTGKAIKNIADYCVVHGYNDDMRTFGLSRYLTKGQAYKIFVRMLIVNHVDHQLAGAHWAIQYYGAGLSLGMWDGVSDPGMVDDLISLADFVRIFENIAVALDQVESALGLDPLERNTVDYTKIPDVFIKRGEAAELVSHLIDRLYGTEL